MITYLQKSIYGITFKNKIKIKKEKERKSNLYFKVMYKLKITFYKRKIYLICNVNLKYYRDLFKKNN